MEGERTALSRVHRGTLIVVLGLAVAAVAWRSDKIGLTLDNRTIDPWQTTGIIAGLAIIAVGVGVALAAGPSRRTSSLWRGLAGSGLTVTILGWLLLPFFISAVLDCDRNSACSHSTQFRPTRNQFGLIDDWWLSVALIAVASAIAVWGLWGLWRNNRLEPRTSVIVYWVATAVVWIVMIGAYTGRMAINR